MTANPEADLVWAKALRKLHEAQATPAETFPGIVVTSSYFAMRHAAVAVLLLRDGSAPSAESAIIARFGATVGASGEAHGRAFNRVFDLRNIEDYDAVASPTPQEAETARDDAGSLLQYCATAFGFRMQNAPGDM